MIDDGEVRCGACETKLPVKEDVFLRRACMEKLPGHLRRAVLSADEEHQYGVRRLALEALGLDRRDWLKFSEAKRINLKGPTKLREQKCSCEKPLLMKTDGLFCGTKTVCGNCCKPITQQPRRRMA